MKIIYLIDKVMFFYSNWYHRQFIRGRQIQRQFFDKNNIIIPKRIILKLWSDIIIYRKSISEINELLLPLVSTPMNGYLLIKFWMNFHVNTYIIQHVIEVNNVESYVFNESRLWN